MYNGYYVHFIKTLYVFQLGNNILYIGYEIFWDNMLCRPLTVNWHCSQKEVDCKGKIRETWNTSEVV
jgi:hypothetical protein